MSYVGYVHSGHVDEDIDWFCKVTSDQETQFKLKCKQEIKVNTIWFETLLIK